MAVTCIHNLVSVTCTDIQKVIQVLKVDKNIADYKQLQMLKDLTTDLLFVLDNLSTDRLPIKEHGFASLYHKETLSPALACDTELAPKDQLLTDKPNVWSGFYNKTMRERLDVLSLLYPGIIDKSVDSLQTVKNKPVAPDSIGFLPKDAADLMIENCIGVLGIPLGLGLNFVVDGKSIVIPMAVEEPSIIAAASGTAKLISLWGNGFKTFNSENIMTAQIQVLDIEDLNHAEAQVISHKEELIEYANTVVCPRMKRRGGGVLDIICRKIAVNEMMDTHLIQPESIKSMLVIHCEIDVCEAMGANIVNTVAEGLSDKISQVTGGRCALRILTNLCLNRRTRSTFQVPVSKLRWKGIDGDTVAKRIVEASDFAIIDPFRACTSNKGILNGIDAVAIASGQDWRAIESAAHCFASRNGQYQSLSKYRLITSSCGKLVLEGTLELPIAVGTVGGALHTHPGYQTVHSLLGRPTSKNLASIMVSVGLAQNFAAIRALAITGIQQGHMALHARNIAIAAGAPNDIVPEMCLYMLNRGCITQEVAKEYLKAHLIYSEISQSPPSTPRSKKSILSMFYVEIKVPNAIKPISLNIAFEALNHVAESIVIIPLNDNQGLQSIQIDLLGDKGYSELEKMIHFLDCIKLNVTIEDDEKCRSTNHLQNTLNLISILLNILLCRLIDKRPKIAREFLSILSNYQERITDLNDEMKSIIFSNVPLDDRLLCVGAPLVLALLQVLQYHIDQSVKTRLLHDAILKEQWCLVESIARRSNWMKEFSESKSSLFNNFNSLDSKILGHMKRWQATMILLIDAASLDKSRISEDVMDYIHELGGYLEWEGTIAHDLSRRERAQRDGEANVYVYWSMSQNEKQDDSSSLVEKFFEESDACSRKKWLKLWERVRETSDKSIWLNSVSLAVQKIRRHYGQSHSKHRKDSF